MNVASYGHFEKLPERRKVNKDAYSTSIGETVSLTAGLAVVVPFCSTFTPNSSIHTASKMNDEPRQLEWHAQFDIVAHSRLPGDKIVLPPSALEQLLAAAPVIVKESQSISHGPSFDPYNPYSFAAERHARSQNQYSQPQLPHPLTFRLVNPDNGRVAYAGIREFSAEDGNAGLSQFLLHALGIDTSSPETTSAPRITVHAQELPKGTFVKLRPLEAGYDPEDWKSLLEEHLRKNFTTLTKGEILTVPTGGKGNFEFVVDELKPDGPGICVVDTDLEVDIEALNEEQARETLKRITERRQKASNQEGSSIGGQLDLFRQQNGQVLEGEYVDYQIPSWVRSQGLEIEVTPVDAEDELDLFVSPFSARQRAKPRDDEHVFDDYDNRPSKRIRLSPSNIELEAAEAIWVSVHAPALSSEASSKPKTFTIQAAPYDPKNILQAPTADTKQDTVPGPEETRCNNCHQIVPQRTLMLHENFCLRNNILCPKGCGNVFQKRSTTYASHWHCPHDATWGNNSASLAHHNATQHTEHSCPACGLDFPSLPLLAQHRTSTCPSKPILCQFCHLVVPQEGDPSDPSANASALLSGLTPHELADGARTTDCHLCGRIVRLRDMAAHLQHHDLERKSRPTPRVCRNIYCSRTLDGTSMTGDTRASTKMGQGPGNEIGLCSSCFGPLYVSMHDPEGKALKRRVERRYLSQLLSGCGKSWCRNQYCKNGRLNTGTPAAQAAVPTKDAIPMVKPLIDGLLGGGDTELHFCVDEAAQKRRVLAEMMAAEGADGGRPGAKVYTLEWCVAALEAGQGSLDKARDWLSNFALAKGEVAR